jgi:SAM-dependent methyltransferase
VVASTLAAHHIPEETRRRAFGEMYRVLRPGEALLAADFRPSWRRHSPRSRASTSRHGGAVPLEAMARAAGFRLEDHGDLPLLRYVRAVRPDDA